MGEMGSERKLGQTCRASDARPDAERRNSNLPLRGVSGGGVCSDCISKSSLWPHSFPHIHTNPVRSGT